MGMKNIYWNRLSALALFIFCFFPAGLAGADQALILSRPDQIRLDPAPFLSVMDDPHGRWTMADIVSSDFPCRFIPLDADKINLKGGPGITWVRFKITLPRHPAYPQDGWILEIGEPSVDRAAFYVPACDGPGTYRRVADLRETPYGQGGVPFRSPVFKLDTACDPTGVYYLRLGSCGPATVPITLYPIQGFIKHAIHDYFSFGLIYGVMISMIFYNLFIYFALRKGIYLTYVVYIFSFLIFFLIFNGQYRIIANITEAPLLTLQWLFLAGGIYFSICFCRQFLNTRTYTPRWHKVLTVFEIIAVIITALGIMQFHTIAALLATGTGIVGPIHFAVIGYIRLRQGFRSAGYYILANVFFILGTLLYTCWTIGWVDGRLPGDLVFTLGPAVDSVLLSFALAYRIRILEKETKALARSRARYKKESETDGLTALYNKRYLINRLASEVRKADGCDGTLSFVIMDVDYFKQYNDTFGHLEGDEVLQRLARIISGEIREEDCGCRYGGEEFTVILPETSIEDALRVAERIRKNFSEQVFNPHNGPGVSVTISMGLAQYRSGESPTRLIQRADEALYKAKQQGRNQIVQAC